MKQIRIDVENNFDCEVSIHAITPEHINLQTGERTPCLPEVLLKIEDGNGDHIATFTPEQAAVLDGPSEPQGCRSWHPTARIHNATYNNALID